MIFIKIIALSMLFGASCIIGILLSKKYSNRVKELKMIKNAMKIFQTKIKLTYEPIPKIFKDIAIVMKEEQNICNIFEEARKKMETLDASRAWSETLEELSGNLSMNKEDIEILNGLSKMLGRLDLEGQLSEIQLVDTFLDTQIQKAEEESSKNSKVYKTLGVTAGLAIVILLI